MPSPDVTVVDVPERHRYEAGVAGVAAGFAAYIIGDGLITFTHTEVDAAFEGRGVGSTLAREALRDAFGRGLRINPMCPFIKKWLFDHPDVFDDLR